MRTQPVKHDRGRDNGSAIVEFVVFGIAALMPLSYLLTGIFTVQRAAFTAESAVREATRAFVLSMSDEEAFFAAQEAADLVFEDAAMRPVPIKITCSTSPCLSPSGNVMVRVEFPVELAARSWTINASHQERVDPWA